MLLSRKNIKLSIYPKKKVKAWIIILFCYFRIVYRKNIYKCIKNVYNWIFHKLSYYFKKLASTNRNGKWR